MVKKVFFLLCIFFSIILNCFAEEGVYNLGEINVKGQIINPTKQRGDILFTGVSLDNESLKFSGTGGKNSIYRAISILPNINIDSDDPFGLSDKRMRIRGTSDHFVGLTVEGIPDYGIMPIGPRDYIYDTENFQKIKVYSGSTPSDLMTGSGNRGGALEASFKKPADKFHVSFNQSFGSFSYSKTFLRFDSGKILNSNFKLYTSLSYTDADKWKGEGKLGPRKNINIGFSNKFGNWLNAKVFINYNSINRNLFKGLDYFLAKNIDDYFHYDFRETKTGNPLLDYDYFGYNKFSAINRDYFGIFQIKFSKNLSFSLKPYYSKEDNSKYEGMRFGNFAFVLNKLNDSKRYGIVSELYFKKKSFEVTAGYWHEKTDFKPIIEKFGISPAGLKFMGYGWFTKSTSKGKVLSPYLKLGYKFKNLKIQTGIKYFYYKEPAKKGYWYKNGNLIYDKDISIKEESYDEFLPSFGIEYDFSPKFRVSFNYSKKYERPYAYGPISSFYFKNYKTKFKPNNITLQELFNGLDMEKIYAYDLILNANFKNFSIRSNLFYQKHKDILVALNDPRVNLSYQQNDGEARSYGIEISGEYNYFNLFKIFANAGYNKMEFTKNINRGGGIYKINGKQFPDSPKYMFKGGIVYNLKGLEIIPVYKYIGKRYGDALNIEHINPYSIVDLQVNYQFKFGKIGLEMDNIFNHKYIGRIDTWDDASGSTTYYAASPFTMILKFEGKF